MVEVRRITAYDAAAADAVAQVASACQTGDGREALDEAARLHLAHHGLHDASLWLSEHGFALARMHRGPHGAAGAAHGDGAAAGDTGHVELDLAVAPAARRTREGRALLDAALAGIRGPVAAWSHGDHPGARALARATGFVPARELLVLTRDLPTTAEAGETDETDPRIRSWQPGDRDELLRVNAAAFAAHPEQGGMDAANLAERMAEPWFDPEGLLIAEEDGRMLGFHWTKRHARDQGEVYVVAVDPAAHGRGLGSRLLEAGLRHLAAGGSTRVHLYVEADNAPALGLYTGRGFTTDHAHVQYVRG